MPKRANSGSSGAIERTRLGADADRVRRTHAEVGLECGTWRSEPWRAVVARAGELVLLGGEQHGTGSSGAAQPTHAQQAERLHDRDAADAVVGSALPTSHESRCAPSSTISSGRSLPRSSPMSSRSARPATVRPERQRHLDRASPDQHRQASRRVEMPRRECGARRRRTRAHRRADGSSGSPYGPTSAAAAPRLPASDALWSRAGSRCDSPGRASHRRTAASPGSRTRSRRRAAPCSPGARRASRTRRPARGALASSRRCRRSCARSDSRRRMGRTMRPRSAPGHACFVASCLCRTPPGPSADPPGRSRRRRATGGGPGGRSAGVPGRAAGPALLRRADPGRRRDDRPAGRRPGRVRRRAAARNCSPRSARWPATTGTPARRCGGRTTAR